MDDLRADCLSSLGYNVSLVRANRRNLSRAVLCHRHVSLRKYLLRFRSLVQGKAKIGVELWKEGEYFQARRLSKLREAFNMLNFNTDKHKHEAACVFYKQHLVKTVFTSWREVLSQEQVYAMHIDAISQGHFVSGRVKRVLAKMRKQVTLQKNKVSNSQLGDIFHVLAGYTKGFACLKQFSGISSMSIEEIERREELTLKRRNRNLLHQLDLDGYHNTTLLSKAITILMRRRRKKRQCQSKLVAWRATLLRESFVRLGAYSQFRYNQGQEERRCGTVADRYAFNSLLYRMFTKLKNKTCVKARKREIGGYKVDRQRQIYLEKACVKRWIFVTQERLERKRRKRREDMLLPIGTALSSLRGEQKEGRGDTCSGNGNEKQNGEEDAFSGDLAMQWSYLRDMTARRSLQAWRACSHLSSLQRRAALSQDSYAFRQAKQRAFVVLLRLLKRSYVEEHYRDNLAEYLSVKHPFMLRSWYFRRWCQYRKRLRLHLRRLELGKWIHVNSVTKRAVVCFKLSVNDSHFTRSSNMKADNFLMYKRLKTALHLLRRHSLERLGQAPGGTGGDSVRVSFEAVDDEDMLSVVDSLSHSQYRQQLMLRSVLFWKLWKGARGLQSWRKYSAIRRLKRTRMAQARESHHVDVARMTATCWLTAAYGQQVTDNVIAVRTRMLSKKVAKQWRAFVLRRKLERLRSGNLLDTFKPSQQESLLLAQSPLTFDAMYSSTPQTPPTAVHTSVTAFSQARGFTHSNNNNSSSSSSSSSNISVGVVKSKNDTVDMWREQLQSLEQRFDKYMGQEDGSSAAGTSRSVAGGEESIVEGDNAGHTAQSGPDQFFRSAPRMYISEELQQPTSVEAALSRFGYSTRENNHKSTSESNEGKDKEENTSPNSIVKIERYMQRMEALKRGEQTDEKKRLAFEIIDFVKEEQRRLSPQKGRNKEV